MEEEKKEDLTIPDLVHALAHTNRLLAETKDGIAEKKLSSGIISLEEQKKAYEKMQGEIRESILNLAAAGYRATGEKKQHEAVSVTSGYDYAIREGQDMKAAEAWVRENLPLFVVIDWPAVMKYAKDNFGTQSSVPFVDQSEVIKLRVSTDLSAYE